MLLIQKRIGPLSVRRERGVLSASLLFMQPDKTRRLRSRARHGPPPVCLTPGAGSDIVLDMEGTV
jgi:hypothetical protein